MAVSEPSIVRRRLGLGSALRGLARNRARVTIFAGHGRADAGLHGIIDTVGRDFLDLAVTRDGRERPPANARQVIAIPFGALAPILAQALADRGGLKFVVLACAGAASVSLVSLIWIGPVHYRD